MSFPLADWIDDHARLPHNLGQSGMVGSLTTTEEVFGERHARAVDLGLLRHQLAERLGADPRRLFLTHGATEADALVMFHLATTLRATLGRSPSFRVRYPEYPPIYDVAALAGFVPELPRTAPDLWVRTEPGNPTGVLEEAARLEELGRGARTWLIDETFREFSDAPSLAARDRPRTWLTGTFTKAFGADAVRVGWVVAPSDSVEAFSRFHELVTDRVPDESVRIALDLLERAPEILQEARQIVDQNRAYLHANLPGIPKFVGPVCFDRPGPPSTDDLAERALEAGVLVCPGRFFGDPSGLRIGLTRRSFPEDLSAYLAIRNLAGAPSPKGTDDPGVPRPRPAAPSRSVRRRPVAPRVPLRSAP